MLRTRLVRICVSVLLLLLAVTAAQAAVIYSEDFEGGTDPQNIDATPFAYTLLLGTSPVVKSGTNLSTRAATEADANIAAAVKTITSPTAADIYTLTADMYATYGSDGGIGLQDSTKGPYNNSGAYLMSWGSGEWAWDFRGLGGTEGAFAASGVGMDEAVEATITLNVPALTVTGTIVYSGGTLTHTDDISSLSDALAINRFAIQQLHAAMDVDNVLVTTDVPEPSSLVLILGALTGLLAYAWRKRK